MNSVIRMIERIKREFLNKQFLIFLIIGGINTINGMIIPALFTLFLQANLAYAISFIPSLGISYILNSFFTFKEKKLNWLKCIKFYISYIPNFLVQNSIFFLCYNIFHLHRLIGIICASIIAVPITFLLMKYFAFSKK